MKKSKIPVQKGAIKKPAATMAMETFSEKVSGKKKEMKKMKSGQEMAMKRK